MAMNDVGKTGDRSNIATHSEPLQPLTSKFAPAQPETNKLVPKGGLALEQSGRLPPVPTHPSPAKPGTPIQIKSARAGLLTWEDINLSDINPYLVRIKTAQDAVDTANSAHDDEALKKAQYELYVVSNDLSLFLLQPMYKHCRIINLPSSPLAIPHPTDAVQNEALIDNIYKELDDKSILKTGLFKGLHDAILGEKMIRAHIIMEAFAQSITDNPSILKDKTAQLLIDDVSKSIKAHDPNSQLKALKTFIENEGGVLEAPAKLIEAVVRRCQQWGLQTNPKNPTEFVKSVLHDQSIRNGWKEAPQRP
jgi:hypothetical protein